MAMFADFANYVCKPLQLPPNKGFWCEYGKRWRRVKDKYGLRYGDRERMTLNQLAETYY